MAIKRWALRGEDRRPSAPDFGRSWERLLLNLAVVAAIVIASVLTSGAASARQAVRAPHRYTFDLIAGITTDPFYITMQHGAQRAARSLGVNIVFLGAPDAFRPEAQIPYVNLAISRHPDAILIAPTDRTALIQPLRQAVDAGIPVITVDTSLASPLAVTHVGSQNIRGGVLAAQILSHLIGGRGSVLGISVRPGVSTTDLRERGFATEMRRHSGIRYLGTRYDDDVLGRATRIAANALRRPSPPDGIFAMNSLSGIGVISALTARRRASHVKLVEFDAEPLQVYTLRHGIVDALIAQDPRTMGELAVTLAHRWLTGDRGTIRKHYWTPEAIITRANVDNPRFDRFLYVGQ